MTGRDLIIYILEHNLEECEIYTDGRLPGCLTVKEAAVKLGVEPADALSSIGDELIVMDGLFVDANTVEKIKTRKSEGLCNE